MRKRRPYRWYPYPQSEIAKAKRKERGHSKALSRLVMTIDDDFHIGILEDLVKRLHSDKPKKHPARRSRSRDKRVRRARGFIPVVRVLTPRKKNGKRKTKGK